MQISTIIFDLGSVLIDWDPMKVYGNYFESEADKNFFFEHVASFDWNEEQDAGKPLQQATDERIALFPAWEQPIRDFYGRWEEMLGDAIAGTVDVFRELRNKNKYNIYALSNWSAETFPIALARFEFLHWFDGRVISGEEGMAKPDPAIYRIIPERYNVLPSECLFIDDNQRNILAAQKEGFNTIHFNGPEALRSQLEALHLI